MKTTVTGGSDDLIEISGGIIQEFSAPIECDGDGAYLAFSDGTVLRIRYDRDGIWRIEKIFRGACVVFVNSGSVSDDTFDVATLEGDLSWVVLGKEYAKA